MPLVAFFQPLYRNCHWHFPTWGWKDGTIPTKPSHAQDQLRLRLTLPLRADISKDEPDTAFARVSTRGSDT